MNNLIAGALLLNPRAPNKIRLPAITSEQIYKHCRISERELEVLTTEYHNWKAGRYTS